MNTKERLIRIVLLSLLLYSALSLSACDRRLRQAQAKLERLSAELNALEAESFQMQAKLGEGLSPEEAEQLARQRLGLVRPGEKIFYFTTDREGKPWNWQQAASTRVRSPALQSSVYS